MKKLITMAVAILVTACIAAFASGKPVVAMPGKQFDYQLSFTRIVVDDDIDVQLKESSDKIIEVTGNEADVKNVDWKVRAGILYIESRKGSLKDKVKVTVNVNQLKEILIKGQSVVNSDGTLLSPNLRVYMNANCYVAIKNAGKIHIVNSFDTEVDIKRMSGDVQVGR